MRRVVLGVMLLGLVAALLGQRAFAQDPNEVHIIPRAAHPLGAAATTTFKSKVDLVLVNVTVTDSEERFVTNLRASDFVLRDASHLQQVRYFSSEDSPISVAMVVDMSGSMGAKVEQARNAAIEFFRDSNPQDEFALITFADTPRLIAGFNESLSDIEAVLPATQAGGHTALWDSVYLGLRQMRNASFGKKALLVISDGGDNHSRYTQSDIKSVLKEADVQVYAIDIYERFPKTPEEKSGFLALDEITSVTGGRAFLTHDSNDLHLAVKQISEELRNQYVLGYRPSLAARDGKWHKIKVEITDAKSRKLRVYAKKGYYGPAD